MANKDKEALKQKQNMGIELSLKELERLNDSDCLWCCDKQRNGDWEGKFGFWFESKSLQYLERSSQTPIRFVEYSRQSNSMT